ncbi:MAG TPA: hypothetical protein VM165_09750 [Planctomycetaceae bacterium]|nr:hypothetical protein [Planctomycetaceae bacterium]
MPTPTELAQQAEELNQDEWLAFLDALDAVSRRRRERIPGEAAPPGNDRNRIAAWLASQHLRSDAGIREVWFLPTGAPDLEIRFLEVSDIHPHPAPNGTNLRPIDFALEIAGYDGRLLIIDLDQPTLDQIRQTDDSGLLPSGWSLQDAVVWGRRA